MKTLARESEFLKKTSALAVALVLLLSGSAVWASSGTEGASFLDIPVGAGPAALGSAYTALSSDAYAPIYNPAGLGFLSTPQLAAQHLSYLESIHYEFGSFVLPLKDGHGIGGAMQYLGSGDIPGTDNTGASTGDFSAHYAAYTLSYGQKIWDQLSLGISGKIIDAKLADVSAKAYAADLGALYKASDRLALSATVNNVGSKLTFTSQGDPLPMSTHLGAAYQLTHQLKSTVEGVYSRSGLASGRFGTEWTPLEAISLRAGYKTETTKGLSPIAGLTVGLGLHLFGQEFAYAWLPYGDLGDTQYFSMLLKFGAKAEERHNLIQYQNIKTHRTVKSHKPTSSSSDANDTEYQQLMQLLSDDEAAHVASAHSH